MTGDCGSGPDRVEEPTRWSLPVLFRWLGALVVVMSVGRVRWEETPPASMSWAYSSSSLNLALGDTPLWHLGRFLGSGGEPAGLALAELEGFARTVREARWRRDPLAPLRSVAVVWWALGGYLLAVASLLAGPKPGFTDPLRERVLGFLAVALTCPAAAAAGWLLLESAARYGRLAWVFPILHGLVFVGMALVALAGGKPGEPRWRYLQASAWIFWTLSTTGACVLGLGTSGIESRPGLWMARGGCLAATWGSVAAGPRRGEAPSSADGPP